MAALSAPRQTQQYGTPPGGTMPETFAFKVAAGKTVYQGGLVMINGSGTAQPADTTASLAVAGRAEEEGGTGSFAAGSTVTCRHGAFLWALDPAHKPTAANFGGLVYSLDDQTVGTNSGAGSIAGIFLGLDPVSGYAIVLTTWGMNLL